MDRLRKRGVFTALIVLICFLMTGCSFLYVGKDRVEALLVGNDAAQQLHTALLEGNFEAMCEAEEQGADPNRCDDQGYTLVMYCCEHRGIADPGGIAAEANYG